MAPHPSHGELTFSISITARTLIKLYHLLHFFYRGNMENIMAKYPL